MSHPLEHKLAGLRSRVRRLAVVYGLSRVLTAAVGMVIVLGLADYLIRFQDPGIRVMASLTVVGVFAWTCYRYLAQAWMARLQDVELARRLERRFPALGDRLASAVEFLRQPEDDPTAGSLALRRAVITRTTAETQDLDFRAVVNKRPVVRAAMMAAMVVLVAMILVAADPLVCGIALARLANPLGNVTWPKTTHLMLRQTVQRVARGQPFEVEVVDQTGQELPNDVRIFYRFTSADGPAVEESELMQVVDNAMLARRENVTRPFSFRVRGGDDNSMPWIPVEVIEPPAIESLSVRLIAPEYTGWPAETADKSIRALMGTRVEMSARTTKPLRQAAISWLDRGDIACRLGEDGLTLTVPGEAAAPLVVDKSGSYWFQLTDQEEIRGGAETRWDVRAVPDAPPSVFIEQPGANLFVTPVATVPLVVTAKDDLAIHKVYLEFSRSDRAGEPAAVTPLLAGPDRVAAQPAGLAGDPKGEQHRITQDWNLAELGLQPGAQVNFHAVAADYRPQTGKSDPRRLVIITPEELADRIAARQTALLSELARVLAMQRQTRQQVAGLEIQVRQVGRVAQLDLDRLRGAELNQRQINQTLTSRTEGVPMHILGLLTDLKNNKLDSPEIERLMQSLLVEIDRLSKDHLPKIGEQLTSAAKAVQIGLEEVGGAAKPGQTPSVQPDSTVALSLAEAGKHQDQVLESLERMLGQLSRWDNYRRFHREISQLLREQEELARNVTDLSRRTVTKDVKDLLPQELADLKVAGQQQLELARRLDRIQQDMEQAASQLRESDLMAAETVADALHRARQLTITGQMQAAAEAVESNRMGRAMDRQKLVLQGLQEVLDILANRREPELTRLVKKLREAESDLSEMARQEEGLKKRLEAEAATAKTETQRRQLEELRREQEKLREETQRAARRLERLTAEAAAKATNQAANKMGQASQAAQQAKPGEAAKKAGEAQKSLETAARQLAKQRREAEVQLAMEQMARLQDILRQTRERQERLLAETRRMHQLQQGQGRLTRDQAATVRDLARQQADLQTETAGVAEKLVGAQTFQLVLNGAATEMGRAAARLDRRQTDAVTQQAEQSALRRLEQLQNALIPEKSEPEEKKNTGSGEGGPKTSPPGGGVHTLAELKLLRMMQEEVNRRTHELQEAFGRPEKLTNEARQQYAELAEEQSRLANLLLDLIRPVEDPEDDPDSLPDADAEQAGDKPSPQTEPRKGMP